MKKIMFFLMAGFLVFSLPAEAQILKKISKKAEQAAERAVLKKTDQKVTKETEKAIDGVFNENGAPEATSNGNEAPASQPPNADGANGKATAAGSAKAWSKYNFVPGDEIIFEDDLSREENGEFPSRWDLIKGGAENAVLNNDKIIHLERRSIITPLMKSAEYLPEVFTVEFDAWFDSGESGYNSSQQRYNIRFWQGDGSYNIPDKKGDFTHPLQIYSYGASVDGVIGGITKNLETFEKSLDNNTAGWRHIALAFNQGSLKVFIDEFRPLTIPNIGYEPKMISIEGFIHESNSDRVSAIKNVRIAKGGKKLYDRIVADGKFITRGILFDVNKANLKPESMGVLNEIAALMKEHGDLKFSIEGHTDSDGEDAHNLQLSEQRALAVKDALIALGIDASRMQHKGMGETVPVAENSSPEGKANNRRVEFVKI